MFIWAEDIAPVFSESLLCDLFCDLSFGGGRSKTLKYMALLFSEWSRDISMNRPVLVGYWEI